MTQIEKIKAEIERRIAALEKCGADKTEGYDGEISGLKRLLHFINSLQAEPVSEELEEAAKHYLYSNILYDDVYVGNPTDKDCIEMFKAGAEWQKGKMLKDAVDATIAHYYSRGDGSATGRVIFCADNLKDFKTQDKVKLIIVKED